MHDVNMLSRGKGDTLQDVAGQEGLTAAKPSDWLGCRQGCISVTTYQMQAPDGQTYKVEGPKGATDEQVQKEILRQYPSAGQSLGQASRSRRYSAVGAVAANVAEASTEDSGWAGELRTRRGYRGGQPPAREKDREPGAYLNRAIDKYLPRPEGASGGIETANELILGAMLGGTADVDFAANEAAKSGAALYRASQFVEKQVGIAWQRLPAELKRHLALIARSPKDLAKLDPKLVAQEANSGQRVSELVQSDLDTLASRLKLPARTASQAGASVQGTMRAALKAVKSKIDSLFDQAREKGEYEVPVNVAPLVQWMQDPANARNTGWLQSALVDYAKPMKEYSASTPEPALRSLNARVDVPQMDTGVTDVTGKVGHYITINDMERIRAEANARIFDKTGIGAHYAVQAKMMIDRILDQAGGKIYQAARAAHAAYKQEWVRQGIIRRLSTDKPKSDDPRIALENTIQAAVIRGSAADLNKVKTVLEGKPAWKDLQAGAVDYLEKCLSAREIQHSSPTDFWIGSMI